MNEDAQKIWQIFRDDLKPNASNASRHAIIDRQLSEALGTSPDSLVVIVGAGFDTRAFRIKGGTWIEVDEPAIIDYKASTLPASKALNPLNRIPIHFATESLMEKLTPFATQSTTHIVVEGVFMYISDEERTSLISTLQKIFPNHIVYCDLMRRSFFESYSKKIHDKIVSLGTTFKAMKEHPEDIFLDNGYKVLSCISIPLHAARHGNLGIPFFVVRYFLKTLRNGYNNWRFEFTK
jgi:O-methyltransferase involved in polyketide biosynthesis